MSNSFPKSVRMIEIEQQVAYGFTEDVIIKILDNWSPVDKYAYILHDKDTTRDGSPKAPHFHVMLHFSSPCPVSAILARVKAVSDRDDIVRINHLEKVKSTWKSAIAYLTHENAREKHLYDRSDVRSNYEFGEDIDSALEAKKDARLCELLAKINSEEMREYNYMQYCTMEEYVKYKRQINDGFQYVYDRKSMEVNREMEVMYVQGACGSGKTTFAKFYCEKSGYSFVVSSSSNDPLQDYKGQDVLILDDFRPREWRLTDLLKLLDNHTVSSVKSRYHNKYMCYCKMIIITSVVPLDEVWSFLSDDNDSFKEPIQQLRRRIGLRAYVDSSTVRLIIDDDEYTLPNPSLSFKGSLSHDKARELAKSMGFMLSSDFHVPSDDDDVPDGFTNCEQMSLPLD